MKKMLFLSLLALSALSACKTNSKTTTSQTVAKDTKESNLEILNLNGLEKNTPITAEVGDYFRYEIDVHHSTGLGARATIKEDNKSIKLVKEDMIYYNAVRKNLMGADRAKVSYLFQAMEKGKNTIIIEQATRGQIQEVFSIDITIE